MARHLLAEAFDLVFAGNERLTNNGCLWWLRPAVNMRHTALPLREVRALCHVSHLHISSGLHSSFLHLERERWNAKNVTTLCYKSITCRLHEKGV